ncbi:MAG: cytochrome P460 family protein [Terriglobales bacterium]
MTRCFALLCLAAMLVARSSAKDATKDAGNTAPNNSTAPVYMADGRLVFPANYREWIYLTSGLDMDYNPDLAAMPGHSMFDNVFVNPEAYKVFVATGTWPNKTMIVLEGRMAGNKGSINKAGHFQTTDIMTRSAHIKDARFPGGWAFFPLDEAKPSKQIPKEAVCYSCHEQHGAVDTTFVQFYPTLLEIAKRKGTLAPGYLKEEAATAEEGAAKN